MARWVDVGKICFGFHDASEQQGTSVRLAFGNRALKDRADKAACDVDSLAYERIVDELVFESTDVRGLTVRHDGVMMSFRMRQRRCAVLGGAVRRRGYTLFEALIALGILFLLLYVVGDAVTRMLHSTSMSVARSSQARSVSELVTRMSEEARSSAAVFIPANDVFGNANGGSAAHEVDFFRRLSAGGDAYVAYRLDPETGVVTRYEYSLAGGARRSRIPIKLRPVCGTFAPSRVTAGSMNDVVGAATVSNVSILYGSPGVVGGNDIVVVRVLAQPEDGVTPAEISVHLASRAAPTSLSVLAPAAPPPPPVGGGPITIPFIIRNIPVHVPHGPWHFGRSEELTALQDIGSAHPWLAGRLTYFRAWRRPRLA